MPAWTNWSGGVRCNPTEIRRPDSEAELVEAVADRDPGAAVRVAGAGHSFSEVVPTDDRLVSLEEFTGIESVDQERGRATVRAGTILEEMNRDLADHGLAMENLGDIDQQTLAGALATGTHGTGTAFGILSTQATAIRLITATGDVRTLTPEDAAFGPAQVSLGALGVVAAVTLDLVPSYEVKMVTRERDVQAVIEDMPIYEEQNRNVEFFWYPGNEVAEVKTINPTDDPEPPLRGGDVVETQVGPSHEVFPSVRDIRFNEMEYALPATAGPETFRQIKEIIENHGEVTFPVEFRRVAPDDIPLSPAYGRDTTFIAVHRYYKRPYREFFEACESVFTERDGRPHWGKRHTLGAADLEDRYPEWDRFQRVRRDLDPDGTFQNAHLVELFGD